MTRLVFAILFAFAATVGLSACGKKGPLEDPPKAADDEDAQKRRPATTN